VNDNNCVGIIFSKTFDRAGTNVYLAVIASIDLFLGVGITTNFYKQPGNVPVKVTMFAI
jgi:hypothetical protein